MLIVKRRLAALVAIVIGLQMAAFTAESLAGAFSGIRPNIFRTILTAKETSARQTEQSALPLSQWTDRSLAKVFIDPARQFQTILGFGGAFTEAAVITWLR